MDAEKRVKSPKHRLTCDNCKKSKVRCNQERPECSRCIRQGAECIYSLSHRAGRPRLNRSLPKLTPQRSTQLAQRSPIQSDPSLRSIGGHVNANTNINTNTNTDLSTSTDTNTDTGTNTITETSTETTIVNESSNVDVDLSSLSTASLGLQWAVSTSSVGFPGPDTNLGPFNLDFDSIFATEPFNAPPESAPDCMGTDSRPDEESSCSCGAELLNCLFETAGELGVLENGASRVLRAITASKRLLDMCQVVLCCTSCTPRWSTTLMLCQAADQIAIALDLGSVWADSANPRYYPQANALAREDVLLRYGNYIIDGAKRRLLLRSMLIRRLTSLQEVMGMARCTIDSLDLSTVTPYEKTLAGLVAGVFAMIGSKVDLVSMSL